MQEDKNTQSEQSDSNNKIVEATQDLSKAQKVRVLGKVTSPLKILIKDRKTTFFEGYAGSVTSVNETGEFDVLPQHSNFITLIKNYVIVDKDKDSEKKFEIEKGLLSAILDDVKVYIGL